MNRTHDALQRISRALRDATYALEAAYTEIDLKDVPPATVEALTRATDALREALEAAERHRPDSALARPGYLAAMSRENVEVVRRVIEVSRSGDPDASSEAVVGLSDPRVEFRSVLNAVEGATYRGHV